MKKTFFQKNNYLFENEWNFTDHSVCSVKLLVCRSYYTNKFKCFALIDLSVLVEAAMKFVVCSHAVEKFLFPDLLQSISVNKNHSQNLNIIFHLLTI